MPLALSIPTTHTVTPAASKPYTAYTLTIQHGLRTTALQKRYSDFEALHAALTAAAGGPPPAPLPAKPWFARSSVASAALAESRRRALEAYARAIEEAADPRWRACRAWRDFLGGASSSSSSSAAAAEGAADDAGAAAARSPAGWLAAHRELKAQLHEARRWLGRREQAATAQAQHEAAAGAKRCLVRAAGLVGALEEGLRALAGGAGKGARQEDAEDGWGSGDGGRERLGEGELRRRKDLVAAARKEREGLEGVLSAMAVKSAGLGGAAAGGGGVSGAVATQGDKEGLFGKGGGGAGGAGGRRVLGAPPKETERTRELDNEGVLQLQRQVMREQDGDVQDLAKVVRRMREMGVQINEELVYQNALLDELDQDVERNEAKIGIAKKRIGKIK